MKLRVGSAVLLVTSESQLPGSDDSKWSYCSGDVGRLLTLVDAPNTSELPKIHCERLTVNRKLLKGLANRRRSQLTVSGLILASAVSPCGLSASALPGSLDATPAANFTQFLLAALASYIAVSAQAINCWGDEA